MKYFLIVGEASGDLHASHLMRALHELDPDAEFHFYGGDLMSAVGGVRLKHYKKTAYMGFIPVLLHLPEILANLRTCKQHIRYWKPDVVILVDYPGFNLKIADFVRRRTNIPVFYYISPKIWAWKEHRIRQIKRNVDEIFSILPFEVDFFENKHHYPIHYIGNPTVDEVETFCSTHRETRESFALYNGLSPDRPIIALLAGSRKQEIKDNLVRMCMAAEPFTRSGYQLVLAGAPNIDTSYYRQLLSTVPYIPVNIVRNMTFRLLRQAEAALVTSGTATLEAALFRVPQVVCYYTAMGRFVSFLRRKFLKIKYISLVNLIADEPVVPELVADSMTVENVHRELDAILRGGEGRQPMLDGYKRMAERLGPAGAPRRAAQEMLRLLRQRSGASF